jgi:hypothetical protein
MWWDMGRIASCGWGCQSFGGKVLDAQGPVGHRATLKTIAMVHQGRHGAASNGAAARLLESEYEMSLDRAVMAFAGVMILLSVALTVWVSPLFMWFTVFIGLNMLQAAFTGWCPAAIVFKKLGVKAGTAFS